MEYSGQSVSFYFLAQYLIYLDIMNKELRTAIIFQC